MIPTLLPAALSVAGPGIAMPETGPGGAAMDAARGFAETLARAEAVSGQAVTGGADPHDLMTAIAESKLALDTVVTVRDRVVEAYQEVLRMPV